MRGLNKVMLIGTLGKDPEIRYMNSGDAVVGFSVATNESWKDKNGEKQERTEWHNITCFGKLAEICGEYLTKGSHVYLEGKIRTEKYTDKNGVDKWSTKIICDQMQMLGGGRERGEGESTGEQRPSQQQSGGTESFPDDDIPF